MAVSLETKCLHLVEEENTEDECKKTLHYGSVSFPIYQTATYAHPAVGQSTGFDYSRLQNPTRAQVEKVVAQLEGGIDAFALSSGMAAISLLFEIFKPGDHLIIDSDLYGGAIRLFDHVTAKNGVEFTRANCSCDDVESLIKSNTKAVYIETPTNPMMNVTDIKTLAGFIVTNKLEIQEKLRFLIKTTGAGLAPFDCWLVLRGIKTLALRMEAAQKNAFKIVEWLKNQKSVTKVIYPGLKEHPGYEIMKKQTRGFGAMVTFNVTDEAKAKKILGSVKLIQYAESLGGVETLITYPTTQTHADVPEELRLKNGITPATLRLSVGIENAEDLIEDLKQAFKS